MLFGLPALVLIFSYLFNDPGALLITVPLILLIPGPRDVLLHVGSDLWRAARRGWRFVSVDLEDAAEQEAYAARQPPEAQQARWAAAQQAAQHERWEAAPPPRPRWRAPPQPQPVEWGRAPPPPLVSGRAGVLSRGLAPPRLVHALPPSLPRCAAEPPLAAPPVAPRRSMS